MYKLDNLILKNLFMSCVAVVHQIFIRVIQFQVVARSYSQSPF